MSARFHIFLRVSPHTATRALACHPPRDRFSCFPQYAQLFKRSALKGYHPFGLSFHIFAIRVTAVLRISVVCCLTPSQSLSSFSSSSFAFSSRDPQLRIRRPSESLVLTRLRSNSRGSVLFPVSAPARPYLCPISFNVPSFSLDALGLVECTSTSNSSLKFRWFNCFDFASLPCLVHVSPLRPKPSGPPSETIVVRSRTGPLRYHQEGTLQSKRRIYKVQSTSPKLI